MKKLPSITFTLLLAFMAIAFLPACSSSGDTTPSTSSTSEEPTNCDQALTDDERRECLEMLGQ